MSFALGLVSAAGEIASGVFAYKNAKRQAKLLRMQAREAEAAGGEAAGEIGRDVAQLMGRQKAAAAAQGFDVSVGDPVAILESTASLGAQAQEKAERRGQMSAWAYELAARNTLLEGTQALAGGVLSGMAYGLSSLPSGFGGKAPWKGMKLGKFNWGGLPKMPGFGFKGGIW